MRPTGHGSGAGLLAARVNGERAVVLAWPRAILLQVAHPLVAAGVAEHSEVSGSLLAPARRLHSTIQAMLGLTFGDEHRRAATAAHINAIHDRVHGVLPQAAGRWPAGTPYSAHHPELLAWVHVTLVDSILLGYEAFVGPLTPAERDAYCLEALDGARRLGVPDRLMPRTAREARTTLDETLASDVIAVTPQARSVARTVLAPRLATGVWPATWFNRIVTGGLLSPAMREAYDIRWGAGDDEWFARVGGAVRLWSRTAPELLRRW